MGGIELEIEELRLSRFPAKRTDLTATRIKSADRDEVICSNCQRKQWIGRTECELCGARFEGD